MPNLLLCNLLRPPIFENNVKYPLDFAVDETTYNKYNSDNYPKVNVHKRRLSQPTTIVEKANAVKTHEMNNIQQQSVNRVKQEISSTNPKYDIIGIYNTVKKIYPYVKFFVYKISHHMLPIVLTGR